MSSEPKITFEDFHKCHKCRNFKINASEPGLNFMDLHQSYTSRIVKEETEIITIRRRSKNRTFEFTEIIETIEEIEETITELPSSIEKRQSSSKKSPSSRRKILKATPKSGITPLKSKKRKSNTK